MANTMNAAGLSLLKRFEGWRSKAYKCSAGVWTIGYGHTSMAGAPKVTPGLTITKAEGERILRKDLGKYEAAVRKYVKVPLNDNQYSALVSFCYNVGPGNFAKSSVVKYVNRRRYDAVPARLMLWNKAGGRVLRGLTRRRGDEGDLFMKPATFKDVAADAIEKKTGKKPAPTPPVRQVDKPEGKSIIKSKTAWGTIVVTITAAADKAQEVSDALTRIQDAAAPAASSGMPGWVIPTVLLIAVIGIGGFILYERKRHADDYGA